MLVFTLYVLAQIRLEPCDVSPQSYISTALLAASNPPVVLQKIIIGNGLFYDVSQSTNLATVSIRECGLLPRLNVSVTDERHWLVPTIDKLRRRCIRCFQIQVRILAGRKIALTYLFKHATGHIFVAMMSI